ncbi:MAG: hypothetical protein AAB407_01395 [Patescibacteria group bacterium]
MLDTVILNIPKSQFTILKKDRFHLIGSKPNLYGGSIYRLYANNATAAEKKALIYRPQLTLIDRLGRGEHLKIQFSAQTILLGNNLQEVSEANFGDELDVLKKSLSEMGVRTEKEFLKYASAMSFHPAKNIRITGGYPTMGIIRDFTKINLTEKMEMDYKDFKNGGHGVQFYATSHALTFYDKIKDLEKSEKKAYSSDQKIQQASLLDFIQQKKKPEVMRVEVRLCEKTKMNSVLKQLGFGINPTFADIFKEEVCRKILLNYFETYIEPNFFIFTLDESPQGILRSILRKNRKMKIGEAMKLATLKIFCKDEGGAKGLRRIIEERASTREWDRISSKLKTLNRRISLKSCHGYIKEIKQALQRFKPYKPEID